MRNHTTDTQDHGRKTNSEQKNIETKHTHIHTSTHTICAVQHCIGHVRDFRPAGRRVLEHTLKHLRGRNHELTGKITFTNYHFLDQPGANKRDQNNMFQSTSKKKKRRPAVVWRPVNHNDSSGSSSNNQSAARSTIK
jgi:hypothetical protein